MRYIIILLVFTFSSCKFTSKEKALSIDEEVFYKTLTSLHLYEADFDSKLFANDTISVEKLAIYDSIFTANELSKDAFLREYRLYFTVYPAELDSIYERVIDEFQVKKDSVSDIINTNKNLAKQKNLIKEKKSTQIDKKLDPQYNKLEQKKIKK